MPYTRLVEVGRVAMINYGKDYGKLVVIVDIVDHARALIDAPDMVRKPFFFKRMALTEFKLDIGKTPAKKDLIAALNSSKAFDNFAATAWGKKLASRKAKAASNDFGRFKAMIAKKAKSAKVKAALKK
ncbi:ribosomal protein L14 [Chloropicon primus]|uniref:Ribosomal protein L14 n=1 Tax=Chloropicon primus TaxID=1764295 RepID=A0A5B8MDC5_9CHLO|nr:ribosomal protein L14 [Chloropicon primus]UPQ97346.1 ribosomal protein L14 [Chloropicon primus]|mmetsp:Transcript_7678/g.21918  ORF Transcript_7678/g.21918 Transcript_7678/m.21918 type:complete len:128 (+) Transcript_7678:104-487(+)|eukprot:QDZ18134.1 ribosomal protein L14 [Chloropicon primus]